MPRAWGSSWPADSAGRVPNPLTSRVLPQPVAISFFHCPLLLYEHNEDEGRHGYEDG